MFIESNYQNDEPYSETWCSCYKSCIPLLNNTNKCCVITLQVAGLCGVWHRGQLCRQVLVIKCYVLISVILPGATIWADRKEFWWRIIFFFRDMTRNWAVKMSIRWHGFSKIEIFHSDEPDMEGNNFWRIRVRPANTTHFSFLKYFPKITWQVNIDNKLLHNYAIKFVKKKIC